MVFLAYQRTLEEPVLKGMDEDELRLLWERRPKDENEGYLMEEILFEFDPEEAEREKFEMARGPDGRLNTHHRDTADSAWNK